MPIDRGFVTDASVPLEDSIAAAGDIGLDYVEIMMHGTGHREALAAAGPALATALEDNDLECLVHLPFTGIDVGSPHPHVRHGAIDEFEACLEAAAGVGARKAVLHPTSRARNHADRRRFMAAGVQGVVDAGREHDVEICAENMFGSYVTVREFGDVFADTDASMTFDTGHARIEGYDAEDMADFLDTHRDRVSHVHLNDTHGASDDHLPFGAGTLDFATALAPLLDGGWDGTLSLEIATRSLEYVEFSAAKLDELA